MYYRVLMSILLLWVMPLISQENELNQKIVKEKYKWIDKNYDEKSESYKDSLLAFIKLSKEKHAYSYTMLGYEYMSFMSSEQSNVLTHLDSSYVYALKTKDEKQIAHFSYKLASIYFEKNEYAKVMKYTVSKTSGKSKKAEYYRNTSKVLIALMEFRIEEYDRSLESFSSVKNYFKKEDKDYYLTVLYGMAENHLQLKQMDSASYYIDLGFKDTKGVYDNYDGYFTYTNGVYHYYKRDFEKAIDSLEKSIRYFSKRDDLINIAQSNYYIGLSQQGLGNDEVAMLHYLKVDSIFNINHIALPLYRDAWDKLVKYYNSTNQLVSESKYQDRLLEFDKKKYDNYKIISKNITEKYDIPIIIDKKNTEINSLNNNKKNILLGGCIVLILFVGYIIWRRKVLQEKEKSYLQIISELENPKQKIGKGSNDLSEELSEQIGEKFNLFEIELLFLKQKTTLGSLSKQWGKGFNTRYLSSYINSSIGKDFSTYLNDLRIRHILEMFRTNENKMRNWHSDAIAEYLGYGSREYYIKGFRQVTKMTPKEYLNRLGKDKNSNS